MNHEQATKIIREAFRLEMGRDASLSEVQIARGIAYLETRYGTAWERDGVGSHNWGAVQCCSPRGGVCPAGSFLYTDTSPQSDGTSKPYSVCFKLYAGPVEGACGVIFEIYKRRPAVLAAAQRGDVRAVSEQMYATRYYEGFGATREERIGNHYRTLRGVILAACQACGENLPDGTACPPETLKLGSRGAIVARLQALLGINDDGQFGQGTLEAVQAFQAAHGLKPDGIVGPDTWSALLSRPSSEPPTNEPSGYKPEDQTTETRPAGWDAARAGAWRAELDAIIAAATRLKNEVTP